MDFSQAEKNIGYVFKDKEILKRALTLSSYDNSFNNQTLEFFGDAIIEFIVSEKLFYGNGNEGDLTKKRADIVCDGALTKISKKLCLDEFLIKDRGDTNNKKAVPSAYEAMVAAIYLDGGMEEAKKFVLNTLDFQAVFEETNYKGALQELLKYSPDYHTSDIGDKQKPYFKSEIIIDGKAFSGCADSKQQAEKNAAKQAWEYLKENK